MPDLTTDLIINESTTTEAQQKNCKMSGKIIFGKRGDSVLSSKAAFVRNEIASEN